MTLMIYNTMARKKEQFETLDPGKVRIYVCGPTVYDKAHVGHAMSSIVFDVIRRYLEYKEYDVQHVMNYTDVDDKVILRAQDLGVDPIDLAEQYIDEYDQHLKELNVLPAHVFPRVSTEIETIIGVVKGLIDKGYAYDVDGDVYFRVAKDEDYGRLSRRVLEDMRAGARLGVDERKEDPADFALWKAVKPGEPAWESPWGLGRPGWHIECSAMSLHHLGDQIDIHGGGNDLIFPHHENEIAQSESYTGKPFARYWVHNGMMQLSGEDMSKSTGNVFTIEQFLGKYDADVLRLLILNASYRSPLTYNEDVIEQAAHALERLKGGLRSASPLPDLDLGIAKSLAQAAEQASTGFETAMDDDFNSAGALGHLFELVRAINEARTAGIDQENLGDAQDTLCKLAGVLGLSLAQKNHLDAEAAPFIELLLEIRMELRTAKQWELSDMIRDRLSEMGISLEDGKGGTVWRIR
ncbi:MAG: cysteine--tRNA ligase [Anaerolineales bacterium]|nr:MAG: cysteine--tRNA ligase [Anaerolineales bacterium]